MLKIRAAIACGLIAVAAMNSLAGGKWVSYTTDDFSQKLLFAEYWKVDNAKAVRSENGRAVFAGKATMIPKAKTPRKFRASVDFEVKKGVAELRCGNAVASVKAGGRKRVEISGEGVEDGFAPIRICVDGEGAIDNFKVLRSVDDAASPNLVVNGGMEYVEDTMPPYMKHVYNYNISNWKKFDYVKYTEMCRADDRVVHSGRRSLRLEMNEHVRKQTIGLVRVASRKGAAGVFSVWAKTDRPGTKLDISYADARAEFPLTDAWTRYEVVSTNLPAEAFFKKVAFICAREPDKAPNAVVWIDDVQAEYLDPVPTAAEIASGRKFATPFRENDFDKTRFADVVPKRAPTLEVPRLARDVKPSVKLDGWIKSAAKFGAYHNMMKRAVNRTDAYIACDDENLYIGVRAYGEKFHARPAGAERKHDSSVIFGSHSSSVEFWFDPTGDCKVWQLAFNDVGCWDAGENRDVKWSGDWTSEVVPNAAAGASDYFLALPWKHLRRFGLKDAFPLMVGRNDAAAGECVTPFAAERGGFFNAYDWWPIAKFPADIVAKYRLADDPERKVATTQVMPWLSFYMNEPEAKFRVTTPDGRLHEERIDLAKMPFGTNKVTVAGVGQKVVKLPFRASACQVNHWRRCLRKDGRNILHCGPFPGDFYFATVFTRKTVVDYVDFYHDYCGFRYLHFLIPTVKEARYFGKEQYAGLHNGYRALDRARERGMKVLVWTDFGGVEPKDAAEAAFHKELADKFCGYDNVTSFLVVDEPELGRFTSEQTSAHIDRVRKLFPYNPVQMNNTVMGIPNNWANLNTDVLMLDNYLTANDQCPVANIVKCVDEMWRKGAADGKPCFYFVSGNNGHHYKDTGHDEQIAQCWGSVCSGCTGLSFYEGIPTSTGSFKAMCEVARELAAVEDLLVSDELCGEAVASVGRNDLRLATRKLGGRRLVATCNIQKKPLGSVEFIMPAGFPRNGKVKVRFENRTVELKGGKFVDCFAPYARHVYEIEVPNSL